MNRHSSLEPFSRDHTVALFHARSLSSHTEGCVEAFLKCWSAELREHFAEEERLLRPMSPRAMYDRLIIDHREVEQYIHTAHTEGLTKEQMEALAELLDRHVRWEEKRFFPALEEFATVEQLEKLARETAAMEKRRFLAPRPTEAPEVNEQVPERAPVLDSM